MKQKWLSIPQILRIPSLCFLCNRYHRGSHNLCNDCVQRLKPLGPACLSCANPLAPSGLNYCGRCIQNPPPIDEVFIPYRFDAAMRRLMHQFKYHQGLYLGLSLAKLMHNAFIEKIVKAQCLIPVPMHPTRIKEKGFNHAVILARLLAKLLQIPYEARLCEKIKNTQRQALLKEQIRQKNLSSAFQAKHMPYLHVMIVDDLLTTGATANELARTLKKAGVKRVDLCCCARTVYTS